ncbi:unnamed protein product, partial [Closterium sp. NIES-53]
ATAATTTATATTATAATAAATATTATLACCATMASLQVLAFDHEGRPVQFDTWLDDQQLYLLSDSKDSVLLFDLASGAATTPPATADSATRSQRLTRDTAAHLAIRNHLPLAECAHFGQHRTAQAVYDTVVARYSSPATAALGQLLLPCLFPELSAFATIEDLVSHLRTSDARYRATTPAEFLDRNQPPMFITLYFIVTRFPDSLRSVRDHFLSLDPTSLTVDLLEEHLLDRGTAFLQGSLHEEIWLRRPPGFTGSFPAGTQWSLRRQVYGLRQAPREWHDTSRTALVALGFAPSTADPSMFLRTDTSLPSFYVLMYIDDLVFATADTKAPTLVKSELQKRHTCTDLGELRSYLVLQITRDRARRTITLTQSHMVHQSVEPNGPYPELVGCLMYLMTCTRPDLAYPLSFLASLRGSRTSGMGLVLGGRGPVVLTGHADASWVDNSATQRSSLGYTFSLGFGCVSWRSTRSSSVLISTCEAEIYAGGMAAQKLRWLTYLLTDLGENFICLQTKHIALRYFLARDLQQRSQLCLAYVATRANTSDVFTKALPPGDHQRFSTVLGL